MPTAAEMLNGDFATLSDLIAAHARERGDRLALVHDDETLDYATLDRVMDRFAVSLQRRGIAPHTPIAIVGAMTIPYACAFLGALRAGCVPTPIAPSATGDQIATMIADCGSPVVLLDAAAAATIGDAPLAAQRIALDDSDAGAPFTTFLAEDGAVPARVAVEPADPFNIIYSSGTTGSPKGIVQSHRMRWAHIVRADTSGMDSAVTMIATPLYSNTTLVSFLPTLGNGGTCVLLGKFDARGFVAAAARHRATHAMLVPVQYARIMALPDFDDYDLSSFRLKTCTSAPFSAELKADVLARWPGMLVEFYGMTEGGGTCVLIANLFPDKLHIQRDLKQLQVTHMLTQKEYIQLHPTLHLTQKVLVRQPLLLYLTPKELERLHLEIIVTRKGVTQRLLGLVLTPKVATQQLLETILMQEVI